MITNNASKHVSNTLATWYNNNKRDLPWRDTSNPYKIWISEIILQQTRVNQGLSYYIRFINQFPTVSVLAEANEDEVLKYWQGLGYYSRARNLHKAARQIMADFDGVFPTEHSQVLKLAGIGEYTAAAICSFAYNQNYAVVDGNVYRVLSRLFNIETPIDTNVGKKTFALIAEQLLNKNNPSQHNQAIMEFGALQCVPSSPNCSICPLINNCKAYQFETVSILPVKSKKTKVKVRFFNYLFIENNGSTFLQKRTAKDIWQNLYEFPLMETDKPLQPEELITTPDFKRLFGGINELEIKNISNPIKHILSHQIIHAQFISLKTPDSNLTIGTLTKINITEIDKFAVSRLIELFLESRQIPLTAT